AQPARGRDSCPARGLGIRGGRSGLPVHALPEFGGLRREVRGIPALPQLLDCPLGGGRPGRLVAAKTAAGSDAARQFLRPALRTPWPGLAGDRLPHLAPLPAIVIRG